MAAHFLFDRFAQERDRKFQTNNANRIILNDL